MPKSKAPIVDYILRDSLFDNSSGGGEGSDRNMVCGTSDGIFISEYTIANSSWRDLARLYCMRA